jgi:hypothetical protein
MNESASSDLDFSHLSAPELDKMVGVSDRVDRKIAQHDRVASSTLKKLAQSRAASVLRNVVLNPACPKDLLLELASKFPNEFFQNPAFSLLLLEEPDLFSRLPITVIKSILKSPDCPASIIDWALRSGGSSHALALAGRQAGRQDLPTPTLRMIARGAHIKAAELATSRLMSIGATLDEQAG